jgi:hypothetical protein
MIAKLITGVLALASVVAALVLGAQFAVDDVPVAASTTIAVTPARQDIACPGPLETPSGGTGTDPELGGAATDITRDVYLTGDVRAVANGQASNAIVGAAVERVGGGDITGLAAVTCSAPLTEQWIVGGTTSIGSSARLVLTNPAETAVEATVTAYGELGELDSRQVAIGPDSQQVVLLEGVVVDVAALAVRVEATGTGVVAALQDSRLDGFQPFGTDWAGPSTVASALALPGVGTQGSAAQAATVRLVAPEGATVRLGLSTPDGPAVWEGVAALELEPGVVVEVAIPAVEEGTVTVHADAPVAAGAVVTRSRSATSGVDGDTASELRWIASQPIGDVGDRAVVAVGHSQRVVVFAERAGAFALVDANGSPVASADLSAGTTVSLPIDVPAGTEIVGGGAFAWALVAQDGNLITSTMPTRTAIDDRDIVVEQRRYVPES